LAFWQPETDFHIFVPGGVVDKYLGGAAACFDRGLVATSRKAKENV
jgi:hypothetical protein